MTIGYENGRRFHPKNATGSALALPEREPLPAFGNVYRVLQRHAFRALDAEFTHARAVRRTTHANQLAGVRFTVGARANRARFRSHELSGIWRTIAERPTHDGWEVPHGRGPTE